MDDSSNPDTGEDNTSSTDEPYPWRNSEPDTDSQENPESHTSEEATTPSPGGRDHPSSPRREQSTTNQPNDVGQKAGNSGPSVAPKTSSYPQDEQDRPVLAKVLLLVVTGLRKLWHAKVLGFYWVLPRITGTTDSREGLSGYFYPDTMVREDEQVLYSGHPSRWLSPAPYVLSGVLLVLALVISVAVPLGYGEPFLDAITPAFLDLPVPDKWWYAPLLFTGIAAALLVYVVSTRASTWHLVTDKRILYRKNILATNRIRLDLTDVNSIDCRQPLPERWYNVGYIDIYTASTGDKELVLDGVKDAPTIAKLIDEARYDYQQRIRGGYPDESTPQRDVDQIQGRGENRSERQPAHQDPGATQHGRDTIQSNTSAEGDSIEEQRPNHSLYDDLGGPSRRDDL